MAARAGAGGAASLYMLDAGAAFTDRDGVGYRTDRPPCRWNAPRRRLSRLDIPSRGKLQSRLNYGQ